MSDTLALPTAIRTWPRRLRRFVLTAALATGLVAVSWSLIEMANGDGLVAEVAGYRISATIDEQMMLNLAISYGESAPRAIRANDVFPPTPKITPRQTTFITTMKIKMMKWSTLLATIRLPGSATLHQSLDQRR